MSQLLQEYGERGLRIDECLVRLHAEGKFGELALHEVLQDPYLRDVARQFVEARDGSDYENALEQLHSWQEYHLSS